MSAEQAAVEGDLALDLDPAAIAAYEELTWWWDALTVQQRRVLGHQEELQRVDGRLGRELVARQLINDLRLYVVALRLLLGAVELAQDAVPAARDAIREAGDSFRAAAPGTHALGLASLQQAADGLVESARVSRVVLGAGSAELELTRVTQEAKKLVRATQAAMAARLPALRRKRAITGKPRTARRD